TFTISNRSPALSRRFENSEGATASPLCSTTTLRGGNPCVTRNSSMEQGNLASRGLPLAITNGGGIVSSPITFSEALRREVREILICPTPRIAGVRSARSYHLHIRQHAPCSGDAGSRILVEEHSRTRCHRSQGFPCLFAASPSRLVGLGTWRSGSNAIGLL